MKLKVEFRESFLHNWPEEYYHLTPQERECALEEILRRFPDSVDDQRRSELFHRRYNRSYDDIFMMAWMMLKVADAQELSFFNRTRFRYEIETELKRLCILGEPVDDILKAEWRSFADFLIETYVHSASYRSALFGMGAVSDRNTCLRLANEMETVTKTVPAKAGFSREMQEFRAVLRERFKALIPDGEAILREVQSI